MCHKIRKSTEWRCECNRPWHRCVTRTNQVKQYHQNEQQNQAKGASTSTAQRKKPLDVHTLATQLANKKQRNTEAEGQLVRGSKRKGDRTGHQQELNTSEDSQVLPLRGDGEERPDEAEATVNPGSASRVTRRVGVCDGSACREGGNEAGVAPVSPQSSHHVDNVEGLAQDAASSQNEVEGLLRVGKTFSRNSADACRQTATSSRGAASSSDRPLHRGTSTHLASSVCFNRYLERGNLPPPPLPQAPPRQPPLKKGRVQANTRGKKRRDDEDAQAIQAVYRRRLASVNPVPLPGTSFSTEVPSARADPRSDPC